MTNRISFLLALILVLNVNTKADEGMWIPLLIEKYNINLMQEKGFKLSAEDIYSVNKASMKDAVVRFGGGCTGEFISSEGLLITNHHCGRFYIQSHSSLENDYVTDGFWAMSTQEELACPGLTVTILKRMEDVTSQVLEGVADDMPAARRDELIRSNIQKIESAAGRESGYSASVRPFYMGNQYFLFLNETLSDVRLVGAPPSAIGNFGADTDNWVWPRHTGDFSVFRVYAGSGNKPAEYSADNVPYRPAYHFPVSVKGVKEGDFTMVFGYPGTTHEYEPSWYIDMYKNYIYPKVIDARTSRINIIREGMDKDPLVRIQYYSKVSDISNGWKKWSGEIQGLDRMNTIAKKKEYENNISEWIGSDSARKSKYGNILQSYSDAYKDLKTYQLAYTYTNETILGVEAVRFSSDIGSLPDLVEKNASPEAIAREKENILSESKAFFRNYNSEVDRKIFATLMRMYGENLDPQWHCSEYTRLNRSLKGDFSDFASDVYETSIFTDEVRFNDFVRNFSKKSVKKLKNDILYRLGHDAVSLLIEKVRPDLVRLTVEIQKLNKLYMAAQMEYEQGRIFYPDANSTLRVAYGSVRGYFSRDAVYFTHSTSLAGIMEKDNPLIYDYDVPEKLQELYRSGDFGEYSSEGRMPVCFVADNHTTGGNSGSPVIDAEGRLIGINFDRAWEGVASDMAFNPEQSRNISLDIRYALFIIDKFAGAGYLLDEMDIIR